MRWTVLWTCSLCFLASTGLSEDSFQSLLKQASPAIKEKARESAKLVEEGEWKAGNDRLMAAFPDDRRTAAESFVLGNLLFRSDPDLAYRLHEAAYKDFPDEPHVQLEWALEQHRAKKVSESHCIV